MDSKIIFGNMVAYFRKENDLTMEELGLKLGKSKSAVSRWESGERYPKIEEVEVIADFFNTDIETLLFGFQSTDSIDITNVYNQLEPSRQVKVFNFAEQQLEQQKNSDNNDLSDEDFLLAAHINDDVTEEEMKEIKDFIQKVKDEHRNS